LVRHKLILQQKTRACAFFALALVFLGGLTRLPHFIVIPFLMIITYGVVGMHTPDQIW